METKYIVTQTNLSNSYVLGVYVDSTGSIYMVDVDKSFRFNNIETANEIKGTLEKVSNAINKDYNYKILKETREDVQDESTTSIE
ncbi:hypothetical protein [Staphylococcus haemolyticus]|nr:hypothetical protein [Staphylococcus haemolyticus]MBU6948742.1 hypothetical protein [Staphylococcus haemolyticus]MBU7211573.1 hypothetical protein [Staphylococcus haemolyticus]PTK56873.1 hypothetical protein BUZ33_03285 [Staphylococcus haemolyticus]PTL04451.1 hypothetical protein BUZ18_00510 [Staphylococcus haemolyticus]